MLKRQRSSPSFIPDVCPSPEPPIDAYERMVKRRRQVAPPHMRLLDKGKGLWVEGDSDGEEEMESGERSEGGRAISEQAQRLEQAGEYKHVNTLLHDLHAEQRHRALFSSSPHCQMSPFDQDPEFNPSFAAPPHKLASSPSHPTPHHHIAREAQGLTPSFTISIPSQDPEPVDFTEVQRVTQTYQDTNRLLGSAFLNRRRTQEDRGS